MTDGKLPKGGGIDAAFKLGARRLGSVSDAPCGACSVRCRALAAYLADQPATRPT